MIKNVIFSIMLAVLPAHLPASAVTNSASLRLQDMFLAGFDPDLVSLAGAALPGSVPAMTAGVNPAGLAGIDRPWTTLTLHQWKSSGKSFNGSLTYPTELQGTFGLEAVGVVVGGLDQAPSGVTSSPHPWAEESYLSLGYGRSLLYSRLDVGVAARVLQRYVGDRLDRGAAFDLGLLYRNEWSKTNLGLAVRNMGGPLRVGNDRQRLPRTYRIGICRPIYRGLPLALDYLSVPNRGGALIVGSNLDIAAAYNLRFGWTMGGARIKPPGGGSWAIGAGYRRGSGLRFDYSIMPWGALGRTHRLAITFPFGPAADRTRAISLPFAIKRTESRIEARRSGGEALEQAVAVLAGLERRWGDFRPEVLGRERRKYSERIDRIEADLNANERMLRTLEGLLAGHQIRLRQELQEKRIELKEQTALNQIGALPDDKFHKIESRLQRQITERQNRIDEITGLIGRVESVPRPKPAAETDGGVSLLGRE